MKIQYESTIDETVEAEMRLIGRSKIARKWEREGWVMGALILVLLLFYFCLCLCFGIPAEKPIIIISLAVLAAIAIYQVLYKNIVKRRVRSFLIEQLGTDKPLPSEFEFDEEGLVFRRMGTETKFSWNIIKEINEGNKYIEFITDRGGIALIPNRIFTTTDQKEEWLKFAKDKTGIA